MGRGAKTGLDFSPKRADVNGMSASLRPQRISRWLAVGLLSCLLMTSLDASAQGFSSRRDRRERRPAMQRGTPSTPIGRFAGQPAGAIPEMAKHGLIVLTPGAPLRLGSGARMVTTNPFPGNLAQDQANERNRPYGGIKLIGFEF
jgi:hypothetical protein